MSLYRPLLIAPFLLALAGSGSGQVSAPAPPAADDLVSRIDRELTSRLFGTPRAAWQRTVESARWREHRGNPDWRPFEDERLPGLWCAVAEDDQLGIRREVTFYAIRDQQPLDCRIEQVRYRLPDDPRIHEDLVACLECTVQQAVRVRAK